MCLQTAEPYVRPPKDVDVQTAISKLENGKVNGRDQIPAKLIRRGGKKSRRLFMNTFQNYGRKGSYHMSGNVA